MQPTLLATKFFFPPSRPALVRRPLLVERLQTGLQGTLTLVSAPAGAGKTTLLSEWRAGPGAAQAAAWLSLDASENDLALFYLYLFNSLEAVLPGKIPDVRHLLQAQDTPRPEVTLAPLINALAQTRLVWVLDDYHLVEEPACHQALTFLLEHLPQDVHLVLLTRSDPPLPLARLRARGQLLEIRARDLRFSLEECASFLNQVMGLTLDASQVAALEKRTEGWIAGLQLAALSMQGREDVQSFVQAFTGSHHYILDYLTEEVLSHLDQAEREFLLKTSILNGLNGELCDALTGEVGGDALLKKLALANLFVVPLDDERIWYRYHPLFADLLRTYLKAALPAQVAELHRRAAGWYASHNMFALSIEHALAAQDFHLVRQLMRAHFPGWMRNENTRQIVRWFEQFPASFLKTEPWLCVVHAWMVWRLGKVEATEKILQVAQDGLLRLQDSGASSADDPEQIELLAEIQAFRALLLTQKNQPDLALDLAQQALASYPSGEPLVRAIAHMARFVVYRNRAEFEAAHQAGAQGLEAALLSGEPGTIVSMFQGIGGVLLLQGRLREAAQVYQQALDTAESRGEAHFPVYGLIRLRLADIHYQWNDLDQAEKWLRQGLERVDRVYNHWGMIYGRYLLGLVQDARGRRAALEQAHTEITEILNDLSGAYYARSLNILVSLIRCRLGLKIEPIPEILTAPLAPEGELDTNQFELLVFQAKTRYLADHSSGLLEMLTRLGQHARQRGFVFWEVELLTLQSVLRHREGEPQIALEQLERALALAEPHNILRPFLDAGEPLLDLLRNARPRISHPAAAGFADRVLSGFGAAPAPLAQAAGTQLSQLSRRELELLALVADGRSNKEIASQLYISLGTVKRHTVNIFNKLDVQNRTEAVARARELGLL